MSIHFVVEYTKGREKKRGSFVEYHRALEYFQEKAEVYQRVRLYRERTVVEVDVLMGTY